MLKMLRVFARESEGDGPFYLRWIGAAQSVHGAIFTYVESLVVLSAFQLAALHSGSLAVWLAFLIAYGAQLLLTTTYVRAGLGFAITKSSLRGAWREAAFWVGGVAGLLFNIWFVGALGDVLAQLIGAGLASLSGLEPPPMGGNSSAAT
jgi:hypothetical protein